MNVNRVQNEQKRKFLSNLLFGGLFSLISSSSHPTFQSFFSSRLSRKYTLNSTHSSSHRLNIFPPEFLLSLLWLFYLAVTLFDFSHLHNTRFIVCSMCWVYAMAAPSALWLYHRRHHKRFENIVEIKSNSTSRWRVFIVQGAIKSRSLPTHSHNDTIYKINLVIVVVCTAFEDVWNVCK